MRRSDRSAMIAPTRIIAKVAIRLAGAMQLVQAPIIAGISYMVTPFLFALVLFALGVS
jgi:hypothetical protein